MTESTESLPFLIVHRGWFLAGGSTGAKLAGPSAQPARERYAEGGEWVALFSAPKNAIEGLDLGTVEVNGEPVLDIGIVCTFDELREIGKRLVAARLNTHNRVRVRHQDEAHVVCTRIPQPVIRDSELVARLNALRDGWAETSIPEDADVGRVADQAGGTGNPRDLSLELLYELDPRARLARLVEAWEQRQGKAQRPEPPWPDDDLGPFPHREPPELQARWIATVHARAGLWPADALEFELERELEAHAPDGQRAAFLAEMADHAASAQAEAADEAAGLPRPTAAERTLAVLQELPSSGLGFRRLPFEDSASGFAHWRPMILERRFDGAVWTTRDALTDAAMGRGLALDFNGRDPEAVGRTLVTRLETAGLAVWWPKDTGVRVVVVEQWRMPGRRARPTPEKEPATGWWTRLLGKR